MVVVVIVGVPAVRVIVHPVHSAWQIRCIVELRDLSPQRIDPVGRDDVVRQRLPAEKTSGSRSDRVGIVNLIARAQPQQTREIALSLCRSRHRFEADRNRIEGPPTFVAVHPEGLVPAVIELRQVNRTAGISAPAMRLVRQFGCANPIQEKRRCRHRRILVEVISLAVQMVGARFQAHVHRHAGQKPRTRIERRRLYFDLLHHSGRRRVGKSGIRVVHRAVYLKLRGSDSRTVPCDGRSRSRVERPHILRKGRLEQHARRQVRHHRHVAGDQR